MDTSNSLQQPQAPTQMAVDSDMNIYTVQTTVHHTERPSPAINSIANMQTSHQFNNNTTTTSAPAPPVLIKGSHQQQQQKQQQHEALTQILTRPRLQDLVKEIDPTEQLDEDVEEILLQLADDFVESTVNAACLLAKHRKSNTVEVKDVQLHLERNWNMWIPGFGTDELRPYKRSAVTEAHKQRLALIKKTLKKY